MAFFSRNNLPGIKNGSYVINLDGKKSKGTHWVSLFMNRNTAAYFDSLGIEYILQDVFTKYAWVKPLKDKKVKQF